MTPETEPPRETASRPARGLLVLAVAAVLAALLGIAARVRDRNALKAETRQSAAPTVSLIQPERGSPKQEIVLPGNIQAFTDAPIYARTSGYLKKWYVDI